jgi:hypothetical protein
MSKIALVHSTRYGGHNKACFEAGLQRGGVPVPPNTVHPFPCNGDYGDAANEVGKAIADNPDLIVTAGGLVPADAAKAALGAGGKPYIYLAGILQSNPGQTNQGGVVLNSAAQDGARLQLLNGKCDLARVYLVVNNNGVMPATEIGLWPNNNVARFFAGMANPTEPHAHQLLTQDVANLAASNPTPSGLVISAGSVFSTIPCAARRRDQSQCHSGGGPCVLSVQGIR